MKSGVFWYARFWSYDEKRYTFTRSTGVVATYSTGGKLEAEKIAKEIFEGHISCSSSPLSFTDYLLDFWKFDSPRNQYITLIRGKPLSSMYLRNNILRIKKHVIGSPEFELKKLEDIRPGDIEDWMVRKSNEGVSAYTINDIIKSFSVVFNWKVKREEINRNPVTKVMSLKEPDVEKGILTYKEQNALISTECIYPSVKLAILLGLITGLRLGEVRGLLWKDIDYTNKIITICHNYQDYEGLKMPKAGKIRYIPLMDIFIPVLDLIKKKYPENDKHDNFVLYNAFVPSSPLSKTSLYKFYRRILCEIGISRDLQKQRKITFHSLRHTFITNSLLKGLSDVEVMALTGHSSKEMLEHYTHLSQLIKIQLLKEKLESSSDVFTSEKLL